ncbi:tetratricopeptide repeat protein 29 isoform X2 [Cebidichthys violaceus]|uniref:tetratricopeptide repeat protein 29 isoform X2 n=1 Tax=Cebidichthys violaceus TaxID=271503 RepID=UPI0035CC6517
MKKQESVSDESPQILSKSEISLFRNSLKQNICVELLQDGYHRSFSEIFSLLSSDVDRRAAAEPGSSVTVQTPLDQQWDKLETMRLHLRRAEQAENTGCWTAVCDQRLLLGHYFSSLEDLRLGLHFYHSCADRQQGGHSRAAAEARAGLVEVYLQLGELQRAKQQAELCLRQAEEGGWPDSDGRPLRLRALRALWRIYGRLADEDQDQDQALKLLHEGHGRAVESEDKHSESEACYRLGLTYQRAGDRDTAKQFLNSCIQMYDTLQDAEGLVKSYRALVKSIESEGNTGDTLQCLEKMADISRSNGLQTNLVDALICLGNIYYTQVSLASARAHSLISKHIAEVEASSTAALRRPVVWKETRGRQGPGTESLLLPGTTSASDQ